MSKQRARTSAAILALAAGLAVGIASPAGAATPSESAADTTHASANCPSAKALYRGIAAKQRHDVHRTKRYPWGVRGLRCTPHWAAAVVETGNADPLLEHKTHAEWHALNRVKPCRQHEVPRKLYAYACDDLR